MNNHPLCEPGSLVVSTDRRAVVQGGAGLRDRFTRMHVRLAALGETDCRNEWATDPQTVHILDSRLRNDQA